jgi:glycosyltransferase involved in cell wall biosynthesis
MPDSDAAGPLRIASWPGYGATHNPFMHVFLDALKDAGCIVESIESVEAMAGQDPDILLLHWAERVFGESQSRLEVLGKMRGLLTTLATRPPRTRIIWLVHNLAPHDARPFQRVVWPFYVRALARRVDGFMTLSPGTVDQVRAALPTLSTKPAEGLWHPAYPDAALSIEEKAAARADYGWTAREHVLGYCGQIRPYKGVEELLKSFRSTTNPDLRLLLAGRPGSENFRNWIEAEAAFDPRIALRLEDLSTAAFREGLGVCDVIVAPLRSYLHSGSIIHSLSAARPVLTPATPFSDSLQAQLGADWMRLYKGELTSRMLEVQAQRTVNAGGPDLSELAPVKVGRAARRFFDGQR